MADEISQHKMMAMGKGIMPDENFGVGPLGTPRPGTAGMTGREKLKDGQRAISKGRGYQPEPDHGEY